MKRVEITLAALAAIVALCFQIALADPGQDAIAKMKATWDSVKSYECTVTVHETKGDSVQDRVYLVRFERPNQTRVDIVDGDGKGSAAVWTGGDKVRGHEGGFLSILRLNLGVHSKLATDLRGYSIVEANFGALLAHLKMLGPSVVHVSKSGDKTVLVINTDPPAPSTGVTKEVYTLASNWLPVEYYEYVGDKVVRHVVNSNLKMNIDIPASVWKL
jgi:outer membrane lipoprotein-sorting protein